MSENERRLLENVDLSFADVAGYLGVTRQSVQRGVEGSSYLTADRVLTIFVELQNAGKNDKAAAFRRDAIAQLEHITPAVFEEIKTLAVRDGIAEGTGPAFQGDELWIFTSRPLELQPNNAYVPELIRTFYPLSNKAGTKRMIYFVPPDISLELRDVVQEALDKVEGPTIHVQIVESIAVQLAPHFVVVDPRTTPSGYVMGQTEDRFIRMTPERTHAIVTYLAAAGIGGHPTKLFIRTSDMSPSFRIRYDSLDPIVQQNMTL